MATAPTLAPRSATGRYGARARSYRGKASPANPLCQPTLPAGVAALWRQGNPPARDHAEDRVQHIAGRAAEDGRARARTDRDGVLGHRPAGDRARIDGIR